MVATQGLRVIGATDSEIGTPCLDLVARRRPRGSAPGGSATGPATPRRRACPGPRAGLVRGFRLPRSRRFPHPRAVSRAPRLVSPDGGRWLSPSTIHARCQCRQGARRESPHSASPAQGGGGELPVVLVLGLAAMVGVLRAGGLSAEPVWMKQPATTRQQQVTA
jgi:hypothetical protein